MQPKLVALSLALFLALAIAWELYVSSWSNNESGPIIRVDVVIVYPIIAILSVVAYVLLRRKSS